MADMLFRTDILIAAIAAGHQASGELAAISGINFAACYAPSCLPAAAPDDHQKHSCAA